MSRVTSTTIKTAWWIALASLAFTLAINYRNLLHLDADYQIVDHTHDVKTSLNRLTGLVLDRQRRVRMVAITGKQMPEAEVTSLNDGVAREMLILKELTSDRPEQQQRLAELQELERSLLLTNQNLLTANQTGTATTDQAVIAQLSLDQTFHHRRVFEEMVNTENQLLEQRQVRLHRGIQILKSSIIGGGILCLMLAGLLARLVELGQIKQHTVEQELRRTQVKFLTMCEALPIKIWTTNRDGQIDYANQYWNDFTGMRVIDRNADAWLEVIHPKDAELARLNLDIRENNKMFVESQLRMRDARTNEYRWQHVFIRRVELSEGYHIWVGSLVDIDDNVNREQRLEQAVEIRTFELNRLNEQLRGENKAVELLRERERAIADELARSNKELEKFAYVASHDLQEPLRKIQTFGDRMMKYHEKSIPSEAQQYLRRIVDAANRMRTLIEDLLKFSRASSGQPESRPVDLFELVSDVADQLAYAFEQCGGTIKIGQLSTIKGDRSQLEQVFRNLLNNALKFQRSNVPLTVTISQQVLNDKVTVSIEDNGIGFEPQYSEKIMELFQRLHARSEYEGTGIGLAICRKIMERHGGDIHAFGNPDMGARFVLTFPREQVQQIPNDRIA